MARMSPLASLKSGDVTREDITVVQCIYQLMEALYLWEENHVLSTLPQKTANTSKPKLVPVLFRLKL